VQSRVQVGCGRVRTIPPSRRAVAHHHGGGLPASLLHLQRHNTAASGTRDARRFETVCRMQCALSAAVHALGDCSIISVRHRRLAAKYMYAYACRNYVRSSPGAVLVGVCITLLTHTVLCGTDAQHDCMLTAGCWLPAATEQLAAQLRAHDELLAQEAAAVAVAQRRRGRMRRALIMGAITGASLLLAAAWRSGAEERRDAARPRKPLCSCRRQDGKLLPGPPRRTWRR
jgi:hypothetical protein